MTNRKELDEEFFKGKRPWSKIKDEVLGKYMRPYLAKVNKLGKNILLIDTFAGPGKFEDGNIGSPLLMVQMAQKMVPNSYQALFVNNNKIHHKSILHLFGEKSPLGNLIEKQIVVPLNIDANKFLKRLKNLLTDQTVFLYLDPYALKGCEFNTWLPFLEREQKSSTEILVNINFTAVRRLASRKSYLRGEINDQIRGFHKRLDKVFGGNYWKKVLLDSDLNPDEAEEELMRLFKKKILKYIKYVGYCPVRKTPNSLTKYYIMFLSNSEDGFLLMNDFMCSAYNERMSKSLTDDLPLFENYKDNWKDSRDNEQLKKIILKLVADNTKLSRIKYWNQICIKFFMHYTSTEYRNSVKELCKEGSLKFENVKGKNQLNDTCMLYIP